MGSSTGDLALDAEHFTRCYDVHVSWLALLLAASIAAPGARGEGQSSAAEPDHELAGPPYHGPRMTRPVDAEGAGEAADQEPSPPLRVQVEQAVDRWQASVLRPPAARSRKLSIGRGALGLGAYSPIGGQDPGVGPPIRVYPRAGLGNSINVDPYTGRLR